MIFFVIHRIYSLFSGRKYASNRTIRLFQHDLPREGMCLCVHFYRYYYYHDYGVTRMCFIIPAMPDYVQLKELRPVINKTFESDSIFLTQQNS